VDVGAWRGWRPHERERSGQPRSTCGHIERYIVRRLVEENERHRQAWAEQLRTRGIRPELYLWERCATAFPGVRRFAGSTESAQLRKRIPKGAAGFPQALALGDNGYPKQFWSFVHWQQALPPRVVGSEDPFQNPPSFESIPGAPHRGYNDMHISVQPQASSTWPICNSGNADSWTSDPPSKDARYKDIAPHEQSSTGVGNALAKR
jgi:hypothetical protein